MILPVVNKRFFLCCVFSLLMSGTAYGQSTNPQSVFGQANQHLKKGETSRALDLYHQLENKNQVSGALFINMGLSYIRLDSMGRAKYYFLKAEQFRETSKRARQGLDYVENHFSRQSAVLPILPWQQAINWLGKKIGADLLLAIGLILLNIGVFIYIIPWFINRSFSRMQGVSVAAAVTGLVFILLSFFLDYRQQRYHRAVMVYQKTTVREKPAPDATMVSQAYEGYTFRVDLHKSDDHTGWCYIRMSNGQYGWISKKEIKIL